MPVVRGNVNSGRALIVEDIREAEVQLKEVGYTCDRITHNELLSSSGTEYTGKLMQGNYSLLWISSPDDWHARATTRKAATHWQRVGNWTAKAVALGIALMLFGPPGFLWKVPNIRESLQERNATMRRMRLCHFGNQFDPDSKPSGSYLQPATTANISTKLWQCKCGMPIQEHTLDWYGRGEAHADWRKKTTVKLTKEVAKTLDLRGNVHS